MYGIQNLWAFVLSGILLNLTPGQDTFYILGRSIAQGKKAGVLSVAGISTGGVIHCCIAAFGLAALFKVYPIALIFVQYAGALYLIYLGIRMIFSGEAIHQEQSGDLACLNGGGFQIYRQGLLTNLLNPKVALFFLSFLPQFINTSQDFGAIPFLILGSIFITTGTIWCLILAVFASSLSGFLRENKKAAFLLPKFCGILFIILALNLTFVQHPVRIG